MNEPWQPLFQALAFTLTERTRSGDIRVTLNAGEVLPAIAALAGDALMTIYGDNAMELGVRTAEFNEMVQRRVERQLVAQRADVIPFRRKP